jgi:hypothetical protein
MRHPSEDLWKEDERLELLIKNMTAQFNTGYYEYGYTNAIQTVIDRHLFLC